MCQFEHEDKKIKLLLSWSKVGQPKLAPILLKKIKGINLISVKALDREPKKGAPFMILTKEITEAQHSDSFRSPPVIMKFADVISKDLLDKLPLMHDIQHAIDLVPGASIHILSHYKNESYRAWNQEASWWVDKK